jgi:pimeloyl-ACP methyl ester carboxylesterase
MRQLVSSDQLSAFRPSFTVRCPAISDDGEAVAAIVRPRDGRDIVTIWDGNAAPVETPHDGAHHLVAGHGDVRFVVCGAVDGTAWLSLVRPGGQCQPVPTPSAQAVRTGAQPTHPDGTVAAAVQARGTRSSVVLLVREPGSPRVLWDSGGHLVPQTWLGDSLICSSRRANDDVRLYRISPAGRAERVNIDAPPCRIEVVGADETTGKLLVLGDFGGEWRRAGWLAPDGGLDVIGDDREADVDAVACATTRLVVTWNVDGGSVTSIVDRRTGVSRELPATEGVRSVRLDRTGRHGLICEDQPCSPQRLTVVRFDGVDPSRTCAITSATTDARPCLRPEREHATGVPLLVYRPDTDVRGTAVVLHGGPSSQWRRHYAMEGFVQYLAANGVAVVLPDLAGSTGFGATWAGRVAGDALGAIRSDLDDVVAHVTDRHPVVPMTIVGMSYGGLAALMLAASPPPTLAGCAAIGAPVDLAETIRTLRPDHGQSADLLFAGASERDLSESSPQAMRFAVPLLLVNGAADPVAGGPQTRRFVDTVTRAGSDVRHVSIEGADHGLGTPYAATKVLEELSAFIERVIDRRTP